MKIAMVFDGLQVGGIERVGADYVKLLQQLGHKVTVFNLNPKLNDMEKEYRNECNIIHINFPRKLAPEQCTKLIKYNILGQFIYSFVYIVMLLINFLYKIICHRRRILKQKYDLAIAFSGHYNDLTFVASGFVKCKKKMCWLHGALYGYVLISDGFLNLYKKIKNLVVLVDIFQDEVLITNKQLSLNIYKLYNPSFIAFKEIDNEKVLQLKKKYGSFVMMVGRIAEDKDQLTLIKAIEYIKKKYKFQEKLVLVGDGIKRRELEEYVINHELLNTVIFEGNRIDIQNYYSAAYLFAHSSPLEGLPTTLIEALYFQLPIVATDSLPGVREILGNNNYGVITPVADFEKLGEAIYTMYFNKELYKSYYEKSKERFKDFSPERIKEKLNNILLE